jgi:hypothetical protein
MRGARDQLVLELQRLPSRRVNARFGHKARWSSAQLNGFGLALSRLLRGGRELGGSEGGDAFAQEGAGAEEDGGGGEDERGIR